MLSVYLCALPKVQFPAWTEGNEHDNKSVHLFSNDASTPFDEGRSLSDAESYSIFFSANTHTHTHETYFVHSCSRVNIFHLTHKEHALIARVLF